MEYYSAIKRNKIMPFVSTWMQLEIIKLSKLERERQIPCDITCMWNLNYGIDFPSTKQKPITDVESRLISRGLGREREMDREFGVAG